MLFSGVSVANRQLSQDHILVRELITNEAKTSFRMKISEHNLAATVALPEPKVQSLS